VSFVWIRRNQFTFHLSVSLYTCGTIDSYHVNTSIINGKHGLMVRLKMKRHRNIKMTNLCLKRLRTSRYFSGSQWRGKKGRKIKRLQRTLRLRNSQFSSDTYSIGKSLRLVMSSISYMLRRVSLKVPSVYC
jgi:hypothetical protein